jgi:hypothetical protein
MTFAKNLNVFQQIFASVDERTLAIINQTENNPPKTSTNDPKFNTLIPIHHPVEISTLPQSCRSPPTSGPSNSISPKRGIPIHPTSSLVQQIRVSPVKRSPISNEKGRNISEVEANLGKTQHNVMHSETGEAIALVEKLEVTLREKQELMVKARSALTAARNRRKSLEQKNTELEVMIQQLNESIRTLNERILTAEKEYQNRETECETVWKNQVNELMIQIQRTTS